MGHVILLPEILDVAGRDGWLSVLISLPLGLLFGYAIYRFRIRHPEQDFHSVTVHLYGKLVGNVIVILLGTYFAWLGVLSVSRLADMVQIGFMPETPLWIIVASFMVACWYAVNKGMKTIAFAAGVLMVISIPIGYIVSILSVPLKDFHSLKPILEFGWSPAFIGALVIISVWMELLFLMVIPLEKSGMEKIFRIWSFGIIWNGLMILFPVTGVIMIFGLGQVSNSNYPALDTVRYISLGFLDRFDLYAMLLMGFGCYIRTSIYLYLSYDLIVRKRLNQNGFRTIGVVALCVIIFAGSLYLVSDHLRLQMSTILYTYAIVLYPLPFLYVLLSRLKKTKLETGGATKMNQ